MSLEDEIPCVFQIPLTYGHNHEPVEPEKILLIHQAIVRQFHGFTPLGLIRDGTWVDESEGRVVSEDQMRVEVWSRGLAFPTSNCWSARSVMRLARNRCS